MTSKMMALKLLDLTFMAFTAILLLAAVGVPIEGMIDMSPREFQGIVLFVLFGVLWLSHAIATSDSAP
jgi:hypothetical protein